MKTLEQLGISPAPWTAEANALGESCPCRKEAKK